MGVVEFELHRELRRRWLLWREALISAGMVEPNAAREELVRRQRAWETTPHPNHGGITPVAAVARERKASRRR
jgi:hypothetical protein